MAGRKAGGHLEQTGQLSSLGSVIGALARQRKPPINWEKIGGEGGHAYSLEQIQPRKLMFPGGLEAARAWPALLGK